MPIRRAAGKKPRLLKDTSIYIDSRPKGASYTIEFQTYPFKWMLINILFDKDGDYEASNKRADILTENNKEQGIGYKKSWTVYVADLKCLGGVFSRSRGGVLKSLSSKNYSLTCGYYDKVEGRRLLIVDYRYSYAGNELRLQKDKNIPRSELPTVKQVEDGLKQAVKKLVSTIKIKNLDRERMEKEGLMHYDKKFAISEY